MSQFAFTFGVSPVAPEKTMAAVPSLGGATSVLQLASVLQFASTPPPPSHVKVAAFDTAAENVNASNSPCGKNFHCISHLGYHGPLPRCPQSNASLPPMHEKSGYF